VLAEPIQRKHSTSAKLSVSDKQKNVQHR